MQDRFMELKEDVLDEAKAIEEILQRLDKAKDNFDPQKEDEIITAALGTYLMNFYNGVENIIKRISKEYYGALPAGASWHKELLILSYEPPEGKVALFNQAMVERIVPYRNFRHRFVSGYGFQLKGPKMVYLINNIEGLWVDIKRELEEFLGKICP